MSDIEKAILRVVNNLLRVCKPDIRELMSSVKFN